MRQIGAEFTVLPFTYHLTGFKISPLAKAASMHLGEKVD